MNKSRPTKKTLAGELGAIHQWMKDHEQHDNIRFKDGSDIMKTLATKTDLQKLSGIFLGEDGEMKFATKTDMEPILAVYRGSIFTKSIVLGAAAIIGAVVGIGWALITIASWIRG